MSSLIFKRERETEREERREKKRENIYLVIIQEDTGLFYIKTNSLLYRQ